jgi:site-specific DNA recombinase
MTTKRKASDPTPAPGGIAWYARVSTMAQAEANGIDSQRHAVHGWLASQGIAPETVTEYFDEGVSGSKMSRPAWNQLRADIEAGKVGTVVVYSISRIARNCAGALSWCQTMRDRKVRVVFVKEAIDLGRKIDAILLLPIMAALSEMERENIRDSTREGIRARRLKDPKWGIARKPVGSPGGPRFTDADKEAAVARVAAGEALRAVARSLGTHHNVVIDWVRAAAALTK